MGSIKVKMRHICRKTTAIAFLAAHDRAALLWFIPVEGVHSRRPPSGKYLESCHTDGKS